MGIAERIKKRDSEYYSASELRRISETYFKDFAYDVLPVSDSLGYRNGNKYDLLIGGWTKFWNEVLMPEDPLSPDLIKALIATESSFNQIEDKRISDGLARGLIQITESTRKILQNLNGEIKNHNIELTIEESRDPVTNIGAGIRWLHHKKFLLENRIKRKATWKEAIAEYKGITKQLGKNSPGKADEIMDKLDKLFFKLEIQRKGKR